jgi:hypothetical protein
MTCGMTCKGLAVIIKFNFLKSWDHKKVLLLAKVFGGQVVKPTLWNVVVTYKADTGRYNINDIISLYHFFDDIDIFYINFWSVIFIWYKILFGGCLQLYHIFFIGINISIIYHFYALLDGFPLKIWNFL